MQTLLQVASRKPLLVYFFALLNAKVVHQRLLILLVHQVELDISCRKSSQLSVASESDLYLVRLQLFVHSLLVDHCLNFHQLRRWLQGVLAESNNLLYLGFKLSFLLLDICYHLICLLLISLAGHLLLGHFEALDLLSGLIDLIDNLLSNSFQLGTACVLIHSK